MRRLLLLMVAFVLFGALVLAEFAPEVFTQTRGSGPIQTPELALQVFERFAGEGIAEPYEVVVRMATAGNLQDECPLGVIHRDSPNIPLWIVAAEGQIHPHLFNFVGIGPKPGGPEYIRNSVFVKIDPVTGGIAGYGALADTSAYDCIAAMPADRRVPIYVTPMPTPTSPITWPTPPPSTPLPYPGP